MLLGAVAALAPTADTPLAQPWRWQSLTALTWLLGSAAYLTLAAVRIGRFHRSLAALPFAADGVQRLRPHQPVDRCVRLADADPDLEPLGPAAAGAGVLRDRVAWGQQAAVDAGAAGIHHLGGRSVAGRRADDGQLAQGREVGSLRGHGLSLPKGSGTRPNQAGCGCFVAARGFASGRSLRPRSSWALAATTMVETLMTRDGLRGTVENR